MSPSSRTVFSICSLTRIWCSFVSVDHSVYDSFSWVENYGDPGFRYFQVAAQLWGLMALRLASSSVLPFDPRLQATALEDYLAALLPSSDSDESNSDMDNGSGLVSVSEVDFMPLAQSISNFRAAADTVGRLAVAVAARVDSGDDAVSILEGVPAEAVAEAGKVGLRGARGGERGGNITAGAAELLTLFDLNDRLAMTERRFLSREGLPGRTWFRHVLQAPGLYLG